MGTTSHGAHAASDALARAAALGKRVHELRSARGFTLQEFAQSSGLTAPTLSALENGDPRVPIPVLFAVADALELAPGELFAPAPATAASASHDASAARASAPRPGGVAAAPRGYRPLEMPDPWEPPRGASVPVTRVAAPRAAHAAPVFVAPPPSAPAPAVPAPASRPAPVRPVPRTFADLRTGVLAERTFATLPEFAVAAVVEAGHPVSVVASVFRVPSWRLEAWVRDGVATPAQPKTFRRGR